MLRGADTTKNSLFPAIACPKRPAMYYYRSRSERYWFYGPQGACKGREGWSRGAGGVPRDSTLRGLYMLRGVCKTSTASKASGNGITYQPSKFMAYAPHTIQFCPHALCITNFFGLIVVEVIMVEWSVRIHSTGWPQVQIRVKAGQFFYIFFSAF